MYRTSLKKSEKMPLILSTALELVIAEDKQIILECLDESFAIKDIGSEKARAALLLTIEKNYLPMFQYLLEQGVLLIKLTELPNNVFGYQVSLSEPLKRAIECQRTEMVKVIIGKMVEQYDSKDSDYNSTLTILQQAKYVALDLDEAKKHTKERRAEARKNLSETQRAIENIIDKARQQIEAKYKAYQENRPICSIM